MSALEIKITREEYPDIPELPAGFLWYSIRDNKVRCQECLKIIDYNKVEEHKGECHHE